VYEKKLGIEETGKIAKILKEQEELRECRFHPETTPLNKKILSGEKNPVKGFDENVYRMKKADFDRKLQNLIKENMGRSADEVMRSLERYEGFMQVLGINKNNNSPDNQDPISKTAPTFNFESEYVGNSDTSELEELSINSEMSDLPPNTRKPSKKDTLRHINQKFAHAYDNPITHKNEFNIDPKIQPQINFTKKTDAQLSISEPLASNMLSKNPEPPFNSNVNYGHDFLLSEQQHSNEFKNNGRVENDNRFSVHLSDIEHSRVPGESLHINATSHYMPQPSNSLVNSSGPNSRLGRDLNMIDQPISTFTENKEDNNSSAEYHHSIWDEAQKQSQEFVPTTPIAGYDTFKSDINITPHNFTLKQTDVITPPNVHTSETNKERTSGNCFENEVDIEEEAEEEIDHNDPFFNNDTSIGQPGRSTEMMQELMKEGSSEDSKDQSDNGYEVRPPYLQTFGNEFDRIETSGYLINLDIELPTGKHEQLHIKSFKEINSTIDKFVEQHNLIEEAKGYLKQLIADQLQTLGFGELSRDFMH
jgi:hypothetical protein